MHEEKPTPLLQKIFDLRRSKKITLVELGQVMGVKKSTAGKIENGDIPIKVEHIQPIAKLLGIEEWELFVDYEQGEIGPLSREEQKVILAFRQVK